MEKWIFQARSVLDEKKKNDVEGLKKKRYNVYQFNQCSFTLDAICAGIGGHIINGTDALKPLHCCVRVGLNLTMCCALHLSGLSVFVDLCYVVVTPASTIYTYLSQATPHVP